MAGRGGRRRAVRVTEARRTEGDTTFDEIRLSVESAVRERAELVSGGECPEVWVRDLTDTWVVYSVGDDWSELVREDYSISADGAVVLAGNAKPVELRTEYVDGEAGAAGAEPAVEATSYDRVAGRVLEARGDSADGGRIFGVQIIAVGTSKNGVRYPEAVLRSAAPLYEGAKAFDHHRSESELRSSSIAGLVGHYRNVAASSTGVFADLHLLPSATHTAEALDASLAAQSAGLAPVVGISHDVRMFTQPVVENGRRFSEATAIQAFL